MNRKKWTNKEIEILKDKYPKNGGRIEELEKDRITIKGKANRLGIEYTGKKWSKWSDKEIKFLKEEYKRGELTKKEIGKKLGRTQASINYKAKDLNIKYFGNKNSFKAPSRCGRNHPNWKDKKESKICKYCGKKFKYENLEGCQGLKEWKNRKYCSDECMRKDMIGEKAAHWKGGTTSKRHRIHSLEKYQNWRENIFQRDNYTCQLCGEKGGRLEAHHIIPVKRLLNTNKEFLIYEKDNGLTLCKDCHKKIHKVIGK